MAAITSGGHDARAFLMVCICALLPGMDEGMELEASLARKLATEARELLLLSCGCRPSTTPASLSGVLRLKSSLPLRPGDHILLAAWLLVSVQLLYLSPFDLACPDVVHSFREA